MYLDIESCEEIDLDTENYGTIDPDAWNCAEILGGYQKLWSYQPGR